MVRTGLAVGGATLLLIGGSVLAWGPFGQSPEVHATELSGIRSVEVTSGSGDVQVRHVPNAPARVEERSNSWFGRDAGTQYAVNGDELLLDTSCGWSCSVDYVVTLPVPVPVDGELGSGDLEVFGMSAVDTDVGSGDVTVRDVAGTVRAHTGSGEIELARVGGSLDVRTNSGEIEGTDVGGRDVQARTGSGGIELDLLDSRSLRAETGSGEITLGVPAEVYRVDSDTGSGETEVEVRQDPNAERQLTLSTGSGNILVEPGT
ncbi:DUF4097 family beta strand repeat-containing protein [Parasphingorhabdus pacifica]